MNRIKEPTCSQQGIWVHVPAPIEGVEEVELEHHGVTGWVNISLAAEGQLGGVRGCDAHVGCDAFQSTRGLQCPVACEDVHAPGTHCNPSHCSPNDSVCVHPNREDSTSFPRLLCTADTRAAHPCTTRARWSSLSHQSGPPQRAPSG